MREKRRHSRSKVLWSGPRWWFTNSALSVWFLLRQPLCCLYRSSPVDRLLRWLSPSALPLENCTHVRETQRTSKCLLRVMKSFKVHKLFFYRSKVAVWNVYYVEFCHTQFENFWIVSDFFSRWNIMYSLLWKLLKELFWCLASCIFLKFNNC